MARRISLGLGNFRFTRSAFTKEENLQKKKDGMIFFQYERGSRLAPPKGFAAYNGKKLPVIFLFAD